MIQLGHRLLILCLNGNRTARVGLFLFDSDRESSQLLPALGLPLGILGIGLGLLHRRLVEADRNLVVGRVDDQQQISLVDELIILDRQLDDAPGDLGRHRHNIDTHRAVARPGSAHIGIPHRPAEHDGDRDRRQGGQQREDPQTPPGHSTRRRRRGGPDYRAALLLSLAPRSGSDIYHRDLNA